MVNPKLGGRAEEQQDVRKILDELNLTRVNIENDRRAYDKVRLEIAEIDEKLGKLGEQKSSFSSRLEELYDHTASRSADVNLYTVKLQVITQNCDQLESSLEKSRDEFINIKKELIGVTTELLQSSMAFSKEWNCSLAGRKQRKLIQEQKLEELVNSKKNLEYEMDDFLLMQRNIEYAEAEKTELESKYRSHEATMMERDATTQRKIRAADETLSALNRKRQELASNGPHGDELSRVTRRLEQQQKSVYFWENRVSETHRILESQKTTQQCGRVSVSSASAKTTPNSGLYQTSTVVVEPRHQTTETSSSSQITPSKTGTAEESEYTFNSSSKAPRIFQFKKKSLPSTSTTDGNNPRPLFDFQSTLEILKSKTEK